MHATLLTNPLIDASAAVDEIVRAARLAGSRRWTPATSGNFSTRMAERHIGITRSGIDKGALTAGDVLLMDLDGAPPAGSSAETPLHVALYRRDASIGAVLHTHSLAVTVISRAKAGCSEVVFEGYEILKAFRGVATHATRVRVPLVENTQDVEGLAARLGEVLDGTCPGFVLAGHGLYAWGADMTEALRHLEALEFLFECELAHAPLEPVMNYRHLT